MGVFSKVTACLFLTKCVTERTNARLSCVIWLTYATLLILLSDETLHQDGHFVALTFVNHVPIPGFDNLLDSMLIMLLLCFSCSIQHMEWRVAYYCYKSVLIT